MLVSTCLEQVLVGELYVTMNVWTHESYWNRRKRLVDDMQHDLDLRLNI